MVFTRFCTRLNRHGNLSETGRPTANTFCFLGANNTTAIYGGFATHGIDSDVLITTPFPLTSGPDSLHVTIPAQIGSRIFAFSFRSHRELEKIEPQTQRASTLSLDNSIEEASFSPDDEMVVYSDRPDGFPLAEQDHGEHGFH